MMIVTNAIYDEGYIDSDSLQKLILLLVPFAPQTCQTMRNILGHSRDINKQAWPSYDPQLVVSQTIELPIQFNGKTKGSLIVPRDVDQNQVLEMVHKDEKLGKYITSSIKKVIRVPGKICNIIV